MALITKIIKNNSDNTIQILNRDVAVGEQYEIPTHLWLELIDKTSLHNLISSGELIVNDGNQDLSSSDGVYHIKIFQPYKTFSDSYKYNYAESESLNSTTSTSYQNKVSLDINVPAGNYHIGWYYEWKTEKQSLSIKTRIQLDNTTDLSEIEPSPNRNDTIHSVSGFKSNISLDGSHTIDLDYCSLETGKAVCIRSSRLELWRVS